MASLSDIANVIGAEIIEREPVEVILKTDFGPEVVIYDSTKPSSGTSGTLPIKAGVTIRTKRGRVLSNWGGSPATNPVKVGLVVAGAASISYLLIQGIKRQIVK
jgi:hypothetical protein